MVQKAAQIFELASMPPQVEIPAMVTPTTTKALKRTLAVIFNTLKMEGVLFVDKALNEHYKFTERVKGYFNSITYTDKFEGSSRWPLYPNDYGYESDFPLGSWYIGIDKTFDLELLAYISYGLDMHKCIGIYVCTPFFLMRLYLMVIMTQEAVYILDMHGRVSMKLFILKSWDTEITIKYFMMFLLALVGFLPNYRRKKNRKII